MKKYLIMMMLLLVSTNSFGNCWAMKVEDRRNFCLAREKMISAYCWNIKDKDVQNYCLGTILNDSFCYEIEDEDMKYECLENEE